ncbi:hypothetical protein L3X38_036760 [Prunus dulcis]|uniref:Uncharacterized protein n=1 Tax=Prunus dulcis TaxID=3755 RepID=A0AAD4V360_PRUDU|nr:hypothetical protein L3X38_036760 [Prunus dulcis]
MARDSGDWRAARGGSGLRRDGGVGPVRLVPVPWPVVARIGSGVKTRRRRRRCSWEREKRENEGLKI